MTMQRSQEIKKCFVYISMSLLKIVLLCTFGHCLTVLEVVYNWGLSIITPKSQVNKDYGFGTHALYIQTNIFIS